MSNHIFVLLLYTSFLIQINMECDTTCRKNGLTRIKVAVSRYTLDPYTSHGVILITGHGTISKIPSELYFSPLHIFHDI